MTQPQQKKKGIYHHIIYPTLIMTLFAAVMTGIIAGLDVYTKDKIAQQEALKVQRAVLDVLDLQVKPQSDETANAATARFFEANIQTIKTSQGLVYLAKDGDKPFGIAYQMSGNALWGSVTGYMALSADGKELLGVTFTNHSETPGLGGRIDEAWFKAQFRHKPIRSPEPTVMNRPHPGGNIDGIAGATLTSNDVVEIVNEGIPIGLAHLSEVIQ